MTGILGNSIGLEKLEGVKGSEKKFYDSTEGAIKSADINAKRRLGHGNKNNEHSHRVI